MSRALATDSVSMTGGGAALVTYACGSIEPTAVAGLFVDDVRVLSEWRIEIGVTVQLVGRIRLGPSSDRLISTLGAPGTIDPVATLERTRTVGARDCTKSWRSAPTPSRYVHTATARRPRRAFDLRHR